MPQTSQNNSETTYPPPHTILYSATPLSTMVPSGLREFKANSSLVWLGDAITDAVIAFTFFPLTQSLTTQFFPSAHVSHAQEKSFRILIKSNRNQIVFTIYNLFGTKQTSVWLQINRKMVNTILFRFDLIRIRKDS